MRTHALRNRLRKGPGMLKKRLTGRVAFTLIEVMVVTTIMTSQANNYGDVRRLAYQKTCENNLRQIYQALLMHDMTSGTLPKAAFFPKNPKKDPRSLVKILGPAYAGSLVCPVFPGAIKEKGLTYIYNDELGGRMIDQVPNPKKTWLVTEMNAVSDKIPMPHPGGFLILYADGHLEATKKIPARFAELQKKIEQKQKDKEGSKAD